MRDFNKKCQQYVIKDQGVRCQKAMLKGTIRMLRMRRTHFSFPCLLRFQLHPGEICLFCGVSKALGSLSKGFTLLTLFNIRMPENAFKRPCINQDWLPGKQILVLSVSKNDLELRLFFGFFQFCGLMFDDDEAKPRWSMHLASRSHSTSTLIFRRTGEFSRFFYRKITTNEKSRDHRDFPLSKISTQTQANT